jgi:putative RecB family exonuclease
MFPEAVSASSIQLYLTCSLKWRFQYWDRLPRLATSANQAVGLSIHAALNWLHKERKRGREVPLTEVLGIFEADWYAQLSSHRVRFDGEDKPDRLVTKGKELLTQFYHLPRSPVRDSEVRFSLPLVNPATGEVLDVLLRGVIDAVYEDGTIEEYKAPQKAPPLTDLPDNVQLTVYAYAYEKLFGQPSKEIRKISLVRTKAPRIDVQTTGRDTPDYVRLFALASEVLKGVRAGVFIPSRGCWLCIDCEDEQDCREWTGNEEVMSPSASNPIPPTTTPSNGSSASS